jgi:hypothetical protein
VGLGVGFGAAVGLGVGAGAVVAEGAGVGRAFGDGDGFGRGVLGVLGVLEGVAVGVGVGAAVGVGFSPASVVEAAADREGVGAGRWVRAGRGLLGRGSATLGWEVRWIAIAASDATTASATALFFTTSDLHQALPVSSPVGASAATSSEVVSPTGGPTAVRSGDGTDVVSDRIASRAADSSLPFA